MFGIVLIGVKSDMKQKMSLKRMSGGKGGGG